MCKETDIQCSTDARHRSEKAVKRVLTVSGLKPVAQLPLGTATMKDFQTARCLITKAARGGPSTAISHANQRSLERLIVRP